MADGGAPRLGADGVPRVRAGRGRCTRSAPRGYPWIEIDFPEDYRRAVRDVLPAIDGGVSSLGRGRRRPAVTPTARGL